MGAPKTRKLFEATEIHADELAVRIVEAYFKVRRPPGKTAANMVQMMDPEDVKSALRAAKAAVDYIAERINAGSQIQ